jgi:spore coat protein U-like protein
VKRSLARVAVALTMLLTQFAHATTCSIGSIDSLAFGSYDVLSSSALDSAGSIAYRCDNVGVLDTIKIQLSRGSSATFQPRTLQSGADQLQYNLYLDPARSTVWGDGGSGTGQYGPILPADGSSVLLEIYGRVPGRQNVRAGSYSDTVVITIVF